VEEFLKNWGGVLALFLSAVAVARIIYQWMSADGDAAMKALAEHEKEAELHWARCWADAQALDRRVQKLEDLMPHMPSKDDFHDLKVTLTELKGVVMTLSVKVESSGNKVDSMDKYLRDAGK
jgi:hypothetical protein